MTRQIAHENSYHYAEGGGTGAGGLPPCGHIRVRRSVDGEDIYVVSVGIGRDDGVATLRIHVRRRTP